MIFDLTQELVTAMQQVDTDMIRASLGADADKVHSDFVAEGRSVDMFSGWSDARMNAGDQA